MGVTSRPWQGYEDVRAMQELAVDVRRLDALRATWHVGDLAWGFRSTPSRERGWRIRLWEEDGGVVAWSWLRDDPHGVNLDHDIHPRHRGGPVHDELLAGAADAATAWAMDGDEQTLAAFARHDFVAARAGATFHVYDLPEPPDVPPLPEGFRLRTVEAADLAERVAVHRDVWAPSRVTEESYARVTATWPYRPSLDCVVEAPGGSFAAYCLAWLDERNGVGELEPVGTREEFRRRGLGAAVCRYALVSLYEEGARQAIVYSFNDRAAALYDSLGCRRYTRVLPYAREP